MGALRSIAIAGLALGLTVPFWNRLVDGMIFQPTRGVDITPEQLGVEAEEVFLDSDGERIHGWWLPGSSARRGSARALLFLHGNAGNASHRLPNAAMLAALGTGVLLIDYRGYGLSEGRPTEAGAYADARAALGHILGERDVPESRVVLFGRSLGGAIAVDLAAGRALAGVILESTFTSAADVAASVFGRPIAALARGRFDAAAKIPRLSAPLLSFHGDRDEIVPYALGQRLFGLAPEPKAFETLRGAGHNDTVEVGGRPYFARIGAFLDEVAP